MTPKVKICGLTRPEDVAAAIKYGADYLGFIVEARSPRRLSVVTAGKIALPAKGIAKTVAVTVNAQCVLIDDIVNQMQPDFIQFHGAEKPEHLAAVAERHNIKTIKAIKVRSEQDLQMASCFFGIADIILFDAPPPEGSDVQGGHGVAFDWRMLKTANLPPMWALAGGINPDNAHEAYSQTQAPILDVSSGVESSKGVKDHGKIKALIKNLNS